MRKILMHERIKQLYIKTLSEECSNPALVDIEKFAELIVRECAKACEQNSYLALNGWQRAKQIREHFGVEE
jgi:hypothetical protein